MSDPNIDVGAMSKSGDGASSMYDLMQELDLLDPSRLQIFVDDFDELYVRQGDGEPAGPLIARRAFPLSHEEEFIALGTKDGDAIGVIRWMRDLDEESREVLLRELEWRHFTTEITAIHTIETRHYVPYWDVETTRGRRVFAMRSRRDLRVLGGKRVLVKDADGNRYEIPDVNGLDLSSQQLIEVQI